MAGPRVGAVSITDKSGQHFTTCPLCLSNGCSACGGKGCLPTLPLIPAVAYQLGTFLAVDSEADERAYLSQVSPLFADEIEASEHDFPTRPQDEDLIPFDQ